MASRVSAGEEGLGGGELQDCSCTRLFCVMRSFLLSDVGRGVWWGGGHGAEAECDDVQGEWKAKRIDNPAYKGKWVAPDIDNPDFVDDPELYAVVKDNGLVGFELWQVLSVAVWCATQRTRVCVRERCVPACVRWSLGGLCRCFGGRHTPPAGGCG